MQTPVKVLLLEHDPTEAEMMEFQLKKASLDYSLHRITMKEQLESSLEDDKPDMVIADVATPRLDVASVLGLVRPSGIPWIIYSPQADEELIARCFQAGVKDVLSKKRLPKLGQAVAQVFTSSEEPMDENTGEEEPATADGNEAAVDGLLHRAVDAFEDYLAVVDINGARVFNNKSYARLLDDPHELYSTNSFVDIFPEDREKVRQAFRTTVASGKGQLVDYRMMDRGGHVRVLESQGALVHNGQGEPTHVAILSRDVTERRAEEAALLNLLDTMNLFGQAYFDALVTHLSGAAGVRYALVSVKVPQHSNRVRAIAYCAGGALQPTFEYDLEGTTCEKVFTEARPQYYPRNVQQMFPLESALVAMNASSYLGVPLRNHGGAVDGHLFIMHDAPFRDPARALRIITIVTGRAASELRAFAHAAPLPAPASPEA